mmetsp:Transcript_46606/g.107641  ORF Transcript_46606/g.107641 Transcript_46606/m.107641 type:complete len:204 (+) Transcript_46606:746-1357(+)
MRLGHREAHVAKTRDPVVMANNAGNRCGRKVLRRTPSEVAHGSSRLLEADRELGDAVGHEQRLLLVALRKVGANAYNGRELGSVEHRNAMLDDLPESLTWRLELWAHGHVLIAQHRDAGARTKDVLAHRAVLMEGVAEAAVIGRRGVHALPAPGGAHQQLKRASVEYASNLLSTNCEISIVLHVLEVVQCLAEAVVGGCRVHR